MIWRDRLKAALLPQFDKEQPLDIFLGSSAPPINKPFKPSAVLMAITDRSDPGVILTLRHAGLRAHAGQVAFPGGRRDPEDQNGVATALREAQEEIAMPPSAVDVLGRSDLFRTGTGFEIEPIVGIVPPGLELHPAEAEVEAIFEVPMDFLLDSHNCTYKTVDWEGGTRSYYEFIWQDHRIWGVTAAMLVNLARRIDEADTLVSSQQP